MPHETRRETRKCRGIFWMLETTFSSVIRVVQRNADDLVGVLYGWQEFDALEVDLGSLTQLCCRVPEGVSATPQQCFQIPWKLRCLIGQAAIRAVRAPERD